MSIRPLPAEVVAQIKSSTAIVSLGGVVVELVKNSLDAKATKIDVTVDFTRGGCVVEDDGLGIPPAEFPEDGGLGKRYWTSKFNLEGPHLGQHGTFLASLSAVSLLTITSHHHAYRSQNSISFHHTQSIERQIPAPAYNFVHGQHGTRVTVRNLFGNMPVRVKQRAIAMEQKTEQQRLRNALKQDAVGLLLSWQGPVSLRIREADGSIIVHVNTSNTVVAGSTRSAVSERPRSAQLSSILQIMTQANYININEWPSWVSASASTPTISVKGAISLEPAPTKHAQFISFGLRPLSSQSGGNELYDQVNRLFALSSFGTIEDDADVDEQEALRRLSDKRHANNGYTNRQLRGRKGVDRYPMFHLRVLLKDDAASHALNDRFTDKSNLQAIVDVFNAMIMQWLSVHHFSSRTLHHMRGRWPNARTARQDVVEQRDTPSRKRQASLDSRTASPSPELRSLAVNPRKKQRSAGTLSEIELGRPRSQAFTDWSRVKSGRSSFFATAGQTPKFSSLDLPQEERVSLTHEDSSYPFCNNSRQQTTDLDNAPVIKKALCGAAMAASSEAEHSRPSVPEDKDETMMWTDPSSKKTYHLNARTGCVIPPRSPQILSLSTRRLTTRKSLPIPSSKSATTEPTKTSWLNYLLQNWDNPIFKTSEQSIQQLSLQDSQDQDDTRHSHKSHMHCSPFDMQKAFNDACATSTKLSKDALRHAEVISQVDKKFILAKMAGSLAEPGAQSHADVMVLIDQHAADERVRVESLLHDLCRPVRDHERPVSALQSMNKSVVAQVILDKPLHFTISPHELTHFETFRANFAAWSILYDITSFGPLASKHGTVEKGKCKLSVTALSPSISERCKADPELLISFLRSAMWKYVESPSLPPATLDDPHTSWVNKVAACPPGLVDMINSRACRSAIMFNDELSLAECRVLVSRLADCVFPFMCAHGRPSMVPIVDMAQVGKTNQTGDESNAMSFVDAWTRWKRPQ